MTDETFTTYRLHFKLDKLTKMPNELLGAHYFTRSAHKKNVMKQVIGALHGLRMPKEPIRRARLTLTRRSASEPDYDGLAGSFKAVLDSLVQLKILEDDKPVNIGKPTYLWEMAPPGKGSISVLLEGLGPV